MAEIAPLLIGTAALVTAGWTVWISKPPALTWCGAYVSVAKRTTRRADVTCIVCNQRIAAERARMGVS